MWKPNKNVITPPNTLSHINKQILESPYGNLTRLLQPIPLNVQHSRVSHPITFQANSSRLPSDSFTKEEEVLTPL